MGSPSTMRQVGPITASPASIVRSVAPFLPPPQPSLGISLSNTCKEWDGVSETLF